jgi:predicted PurR-regulated permease PerM
VREKIFLYFLLAITGGFALLAILMLLPFLKPILWAVIFSLVLYPLHIKLSQWVRGNTLSALVLTLIVFLLVVIPFTFVLAVAIRQSVELIHIIANAMQANAHTQMMNRLIELNLLERFLTEEYAQKLKDYIASQEFQNLLLSTLRDLVQKILGMLTSLFPAIGAFVFKTFVFLLTLFFILRDGPKFVRFIERFTPMHKEDVGQVSLTVYKTVLATVYGSIGVGLVQGLVGFVGYRIVGLDYSTLLGIATFMSSFVPPFGSGFIWFPVALYTFFEKSQYYGIFMFLYGFLIISTIDNLVRPAIMKMGIRIPYIILFFSIVGGLLTFGFVGIFLGPIIFTTLFTLALIYEKRVLKEQT